MAAQGTVAQASAEAQALEVVKQREAERREREHRQRAERESEEQRREHKAFWQVSQQPLEPSHESNLFDRNPGRYMLGHPSSENDL